MKRNEASFKAAFAVSLAAAVALLTWGKPGYAAEPAAPAKAQTPQQACQQLLSVGTFALGGVGFVGTTSEGEKAYRTIVNSKDSLALFRSVLKNGSAEAKLYALCGIRRLAPESYNAEAKALIAANPKVRTVSGCIVMEEPAANVVKRIASGAYDFYLGNVKKK